MSDTKSASITFALKLMGWGALAVGAITYMVFLVAKISLSFFKANGMISNEEIVEAVYIRLFTVEPVFFFMMLVGFAGVGATAFLFSNSQFNYFKKLTEALQDFARNGVVHSPKNLGPFARNYAHFKEVVRLRLDGKGEEAAKQHIASLEKIWPKSPVVSWIDQLQFAGVAVLIAGFFTMLSVIFFWKVTDRLIELSGALIRYKSAHGPKFFMVQTEIVTLVMWTVFILMMVAFAQTGFQFGRKVSEASYAVLRDLKRFMCGELDHRVVLRNDDPAQTYVEDMNDALVRIAERIRGSK